MAAARGVRPASRSATDGSGAVGPQPPGPGRRSRRRSRGRRVCPLAVWNFFTAVSSACQRLARASRGRRTAGRCAPGPAPTAARRRPRPAPGWPRPGPPAGRRAALPPAPPGVGVAPAPAPGPNTWSSASDRLGAEADPVVVEHQHPGQLRIAATPGSPARCRPAPRRAARRPPAASAGCRSRPCSARRGTAGPARALTSGEPTSWVCTCCGPERLGVRWQLQHRDLAVVVRIGAGRDVGRQDLPVPEHQRAGQLERRRGRALGAGLPGEHVVRRLRRACRPRRPAPSGRTARPRTTRCRRTRSGLSTW